MAFGNVQPYQETSLHPAIGILWPHHVVIGNSVSTSLKSITDSQLDPVDLTFGEN